MASFIARSPTSMRDDCCAADTWPERQAFWSADSHAFDVAIVGGGIQGACVYHHLAQAGYRALLIDRGDFACGTSQASTMLIWGGLLYLRNAAFLEVSRLCSAREKLLRAFPRTVRPHGLRYVFAQPAHRPRWLFHAALGLYWAMGGFQRCRPRHEVAFGEAGFLERSRTADSLVFGEAQLSPSDAAFVLSWILSCPQAGSQAMNYCALVGGRYEPTGRIWQLELQDALGLNQSTVTVRCVINAAGIWADEINACFDIHSPCKHVFSKGVSLAIPRLPNHQDTLVFDSARRDEGMSLVPWGPVSLWGSTETLVDSIPDGQMVQTQDVTYLMDQLNRYLAKPIGRQDLVSLRCGVRPLAVPRAYTHGDLLDVLRSAQVHPDPHLPWISLFGGKITGCVRVAQQVTQLVRRELRSASPSAPRMSRAVGEAPTDRFGPLTDPVPTPAWCRQHTQCYTLEDYLRRRTNIAQWVPRGGLGSKGEYRSQVVQIASVFCGGDAAAAELATQAYEQRIACEMDAILERLPNPCLTVATLTSDEERPGQ